MNYEEQKKNEKNFQALTSMSVLEFEYLLPYFAIEWDKFYRFHTLEGKKRKLPVFKEHGGSSLYGTEQKLFFLMVYMKNNSLQTFYAASFGVSQGKVSTIYRILLSVLDTTLKKIGLCPCCDGMMLATLLCEHQTKVFWYDGTERNIQRNTDQDVQEDEYSGKNHGHHIKNLTLCDQTQYILYLSPSEDGSVHDKSMADKYPLSLPPKSVLKQDLGFVGHAPAGVIVEQPFKKPRKGTLSFSQKIYNKIFASTRIIVEHANSGLKRLRMLQDTIRIHSYIVRDMVMAVACGLHNLRVTGIDKNRGYQNSPRAHAYA
jgi:DDE superfamily endonuclease/Helix-turn-helix of DDE superfamily endonuclease